MADAYLDMVRGVLRSRGGELVNGPLGHSCDIATPYGVVRVVVWKGDIQAALLAFPQNRKGSWYGFDRWKQVFNLSGFSAVGADMVSARERFTEWMDRYFVAGAKGFPPLPEIYNVSRLLCLSRQHVPPDKEQMQGLKVTEVDDDLLVWLPENRNSAPAWVRRYLQIAEIEQCSCIWFKQELRPDSRYTAY